MPILARTLRACVEDRFGTPMLTARELDRDGRILAQARYLLAEHSRRELTMSTLALALRMSPATIRMAFCDLENLVFEIIRQYFGAIEAAIAAVPPGAANRDLAHMEAFLALSRTAAGELSEDHRLLVRNRHGLPDDLAAQVDKQRARIGKLLAGPHAEAALNLLDTPHLPAAQILAMLRLLTPKPAAPAGRAGNPITRPPMDATLSGRMGPSALKPATILNGIGLTPPGRAALLSSSANGFANARDFANTG